jgi:hypothetical protein
MDMAEVGVLGLTMNRDRAHRSAGHARAAGWQRDRCYCGDANRARLRDRAFPRSMRGTAVTHRGDAAPGQMARTLGPCRISSNEVPDDIRDRVLRGDAPEVEVTIHPIVHVAARRPQLLVEHAKAYGDLVLEEGRRTLASLVLHAVLLYAAVAGELRNVWLLVALPCTSLVAAGVCVIVARMLPIDLTLDVLGRQVRADIDMIHEAEQP